MKKILTTPLSDQDIRALRVGDVIYLTGTVATCRDSGHARRVEEGVAPQLDLQGMAIFHAGPIVQKKDEKWEIVSVGPTTSMRMERYEADFLRETGVKLLIGKGGMGEDTVAACAQYGAVHTVIPGGCAVLEAQMVEEITGVEWLDLGMPEAFWIARVKEFGPLIVSIDTHGGNLFRDNRIRFDQRREVAAEAVKSQVHFMK